mmetsp:Transcript_10780/g.19974  ORF Transcript_10780/g.19974 Transcript_10780/m.19974 type:complete len:315 (-) Transcript_10780:207-1151(-)
MQESCSAQLEERGERAAKAPRVEQSEERHCCDAQHAPAKGHRQMSALQRLIRTCERCVPESVRRDPTCLTSDLVAPVLAELQAVTIADFPLEEPAHWRFQQNAKSRTQCARSTAAPHNPSETEISTLSQGFGSKSQRHNLLADLNPDAYYYHVTDTPLFTIGVFVLPPGGKIPLHDHPNMCVLSKILYGELDVSSFDWTDHTDISKNAEEGALAKPADQERSYNAECIKILFPFSGGNIHEFATPSHTNEGEPLSGCAILDVIFPPYDEGNGRDCTYYPRRLPPQIEDKAGISQDDPVLLEPLQSVDFCCKNLN